MAGDLHRFGALRQLFGDGSLSGGYAEPLRLAAGFLAMDGETVLLRGIVDEYTVDLSANGLTATVTGRGYAARLLDNESRPVTYQGATLAEIVRCHATPYGIHAAEIAAVSADSVFTAAAGSSQWRYWRIFAALTAVLRPGSGGMGYWWPLRKRSRSGGW